MSDFWSKRKSAVAAEEAAEAKAAEDEKVEAEAAALADLPEEELLKQLSLPDPDSVRSGDDVGAFFARAVPRHLRDRALRSLWRSNPVLANLDGLNDYDGDFTGNGLNGGPLKTTYEVGKGLAAHVRRLAAEVSDENPKENSSQVPDEKPLAEAAVSVERSKVDEPEEETAPVPVEPPKGMRFTFEEDPEE